MNRFKKIVLLCAVLFGFLYAYGVFANQNESDWVVEKHQNVQVSLSSKSSNNEELSLICLFNERYLIAVDVSYELKGNYKYLYDYQIDNHHLVFKGRNFAYTWMVPGVKYHVDKDDLQGDIDKYKTLFQQMLHAKKSLIVNAIDAEGKIQGTASFSVKGLPEALIEFAKQCGSDFQTYSGIDVNQPNSTRS
ncbi:hypothetical protein RHO14_12060 [Orbus wheelerorum]|uniref:hypothetical protein n=1 Tax=Orbus wheelerorum TaxID=3074111 RepID=UPI00370D42C3